MSRFCIGFLKSANSVENINTAESLQKKPKQFACRIKGSLSHGENSKLYNICTCTKRSKVIITSFSSSFSSSRSLSGVGEGEGDGGAAFFRPGVFLAEPADLVALPTPGLRPRFFAGDGVSSSFFYTLIKKIDCTPKDILDLGSF